MTNDLISRKDLLEAINTYDEKYELQKVDVFDLINSAPAIQQCGDGEPVAWMIKSGHGNRLEFEKPECLVDYWKPLFLAPPNLEAKIAEITTLRQQLAEQPNVDVLVEALKEIATESNSDLWQPEVASKALATYQAKKE